MEYSYEILTVAFFGGILGSIFMDITEFVLLKFGISSGVKGKYIGRWVHGFFEGVFIHKDISKTKPVENEKYKGKLFHFLIGGGCVAVFLSNIFEYN